MLFHQAQKRAAIAQNKLQPFMWTNTLLLPKTKFQWFQWCCFFLGSCVHKHLSNNKLLFHCETVAYFITTECLPG